MGEAGEAGAAGAAPAFGPLTDPIQLGLWLQAQLGRVNPFVIYLLFFLAMRLVSRYYSRKRMAAIPRGRVKEVGSLEEWDQALADSRGSGRLLVVDFFATWCGPCLRVGPAFALYSEHFTGVDFVKVDVDKRRDIAKRCDVCALPTFAFYVGGEKKESFEGADPKSIKAAILKLAGDGAREEQSKGGEGQGEVKKDK